MVSGFSWHEAVVAASVAGSLGAPVLMTPPHEVQDDALDFLDRVGASSVLLVSTDTESRRSIDAAVDEQLRGAGLTVERIGGADQYQTGVAVAERLGTVGELGTVGKTAIIASGEVFADALVAGPLSARAGLPVLLTSQAELHDGVAAYLQSAAIERVVLMGGTAALSHEVENAIGELDIAIDRMAGATRFETATSAAAYAAEHAGEGCFAGATAGVARARVPFDSFSAAPLLARRCAALVLTDPGEVPASTAGYLDSVRRAAGEGTAQLFVFGGDAAVSQAAIDAYLARGTAQDESDEPATEETIIGPCGGNPTDQPRELLLGNRIAREADWSPDCQHIAYIDVGSLSVANGDGSSSRPVFGLVGSSIRNPAWSPDGSKIAFAVWTRDRSQSFVVDRQHIYTVNADGTNATQLTSGNVEDDHPTWSPDGLRLAFGRHSWTEQSEDGTVGDDWFIVIMDADGRNPIELTKGFVGETHPAWSPDGSQIALVWNGQLSVMDSDGTNVKPWHADLELNRQSKLSWSPDGTRLAFSVFEERDGRPVSGESNIAILDLRTERVTEITSADGDEINPDWSSDGQRILFNTFEQGYKFSRIFVVGAGST